jgi:hypothetical protein
MPLVWAHAEHVKLPGNRIGRSHRNRGNGQFSTGKTGSLSRHANFTGQSRLTFTQLGMRFPLVLGEVPEKRGRVLSTSAAPFSLEDHTANNDIRRSHLPAPKNAAIRLPCTDGSESEFH